MVDILPALVCFPDGLRCEQYDLYLRLLGSRYCILSIASSPEKIASKTVRTKAALVFTCDVTRRLHVEILLSTPLKIQKGLHQFLLYVNFHQHPRCYVFLNDGACQHMQTAAVTTQTTMTSKAVGSFGVTERLYCPRPTVVDYCLEN